MLTSLSSSDSYASLAGVKRWVEDGPGLAAGLGLLDGSKLSRGSGILIVIFRVGDSVGRKKRSHNR